MDRIREIAGDVPVLDLRAVFDQHRGDGVVLRTTGKLQELLQLPGELVIAQGQSPTDRIAPEILDALESDPSLVEPLFFDGGHPTVEGNILATQTVADWLDSLDWLPGD